MIVKTKQETRLGRRRRKLNGKMGSYVDGLFGFDPLRRPETCRDVRSISGEGIPIGAETSRWGEVISPDKFSALSSAAAWNLIAFL